VDLHVLEKRDEEREKTKKKVFLFIEHDARKIDFLKPKKNMPSTDKMCYKLNIYIF
jgi:hypothetical protein